MHQRELRRTVFASALVIGLVFVRNGDAQKSQPAGPQLTGQVLNHMGSGLRGAAVRVTFSTTSDAGKTRVETATTDELGDFAVPLPEDFAGTAHVVVSLDGYTTSEQEIKVDGTAAAPFAYAELEGAGAASGIVQRQETHEPIAGAHVVFSDGFKDWEADTDEEGRFAVEKLPPGELRIVVTADGFAEFREEVGADRRSAPLTIELGPEWVAEIHVVDGEKQPVADAVVEALYSDNSQMRDTLTDAAGLARFGGLPPTIEGVSIRVQHPDYAAMTEFDILVDRPTDGPLASTTVTLERGATLVGRVTNAATREPIAMARVTVGEVMSPGAPMAWTDDEGRFEVTGVASGERVVTVHAPELAPAATRVSVASGEKAELSFALQSGRSVRGRVIDEADKPVERATVVLEKWHEFETLGLKAMTDETGDFVIENAPTDAFSIATFAPGYEPTTLDVPADGEDLKVVLKAAKPPPPPLAEGADAPDVAMTTTDGTDVSLAKLRGKFVFLDFWATWCGPCVMEIPNVRALHEATKSRTDFVMIGISLDRDRKALDRCVRDKHIDWPQVFGDGGAERAADAFGVHAIPSTFLIGPDGKIVAVGLGGTSMRGEVIRRLDARTDGAGN